MQHFTTYHLQIVKNYLTKHTDAKLRTYHHKYNTTFNMSNTKVHASGIDSDLMTLHIEDIQFSVFFHLVSTQMYNDDKN